MTQDNDSSGHGFYYQGFTSPNGTIVPDDVFDVLAPELTEAELRVLLYIIRRTFGFKKDSDSISLTQMVEGIKTKDGRVLDKGTGMSRRGVMKGCAGLVDKGVIFVEKNKSDERGNEVNIYKLRFRTRVGNEIPYPREQKTLPLGNKVPPQQTVLQETVRQQTEQQQPARNGQSQDTESDYHSSVVVVEAPQENRSGKAKKKTLAQITGGGGEPQTSNLIESLLIYKVGREKAQLLTTRFSAEYIQEKIDILAWKRAFDNRGRPIVDTAAWLIRAIEQNYQAPDGFKTRTQVAQEEAEKRERLRLLLDEAAQREHEAQQTREQQAQTRQLLFAPLKAKYQTSPAEEAAWQQAAEYIQQVDFDLYSTYLSEAQLLSLKSETAVIGVPHAWHPRQVKKVAPYIVSALKHLGYAVATATFEMPSSTS